MASKAKLEAIISADARAFYRTMGTVARDASRLGRQVAAGLGAGAAAVTGAWVAAVKGLAEYGSGVQDLIDQTGMGAELIQEFGYAAAQTGGSMDDLGPAVKGMANFIQQASRRSKEAVDTMRELGLTTAQIAAMSPDEQFRTLTAAIARIENPTQRAALAMDVFGRAGQKMGPIAAGFAGFAAEARKLGMVLSPEQIKAADDFGDAMVALGARIKGSAFGAVAPDMARFSEALMALASDPAMWEAISPALRTVSAALGDLAVNMAGVLQDPEALAEMGKTAQALADGFVLAAEGAGKLFAAVKPLLTFINESREGMALIMGAISGAESNEARMANLEQYSGAQQTAAALALRERGVTVSNTDAAAYQAQMVAYLETIANSVRPLSQEQ